MAAPACLAMAVWAGQRPFEPLFFHALGHSSNQTPPAGVGGGRQPPLRHAGRATGKPWRWRKKKRAARSHCRGRWRWVLQRWAGDASARTDAHTARASAMAEPFRTETGPGLPPGGGHMLWRTGKKENRRRRAAMASGKRRGGTERGLSHPGLACSTLPARLTLAGRGETTIGGGGRTRWERLRESCSGFPAESGGERGGEREKTHSVSTTEGKKKLTPPKQQMPAGGRHSADPPLLTWGDVTLRPSDMDLLAPGQWLNDQVGRGER